MRSHKDDRKQRGKPENEDRSARLVANLSPVRSPFRFSIDGHASKVLQAASLARQLEDIANMESMLGQRGKVSPGRAHGLGLRGAVGS